MFLAWMLLSVVPTALIVTDRVDVIEVNHVMDGETGNCRFDQLIFWRLSVDRYEVVDWRFLKGGRRTLGQGWNTWTRWHGHPAEPLYDRRTRRWVCLWRDGTTWRRVIAACQRETWTVIDVEIQERKRLAENQRDKLTKGN